MRMHDAITIEKGSTRPVYRAACEPGNVLAKPANDRALVSSVASVASVGRTKAAGIFRSERGVCSAFVRLCWQLRGVDCRLPRPGKADKSGRRYGASNNAPGRFGPPYGATELRSRGQNQNLRLCKAYFHRSNLEAGELKRFNLGSHKN
jgi:hypothetical protein